MYVCVCDITNKNILFSYLISQGAQCVGWCLPGVAAEEGSTNLLNSRAEVMHCLDITLGKGDAMVE